MAEVVHRNLELMLPELEELERSGIFSPEEIKEIVRRRRNMEYKLQRRPARKEDYLRAIQYEVNLDLLRKQRKKRLGVTSTRQDAEHGIQNRIHSLFKRAVRKFKADLRLWLQYIEFCRQSHHRISLGRVLGKALAIHPSNPGLWVMAAQFQFEDLHDPSSARSTMQQGLRSNPHSTHLWLEYFRMELMHVDKMKKRRQVLGLDKAQDEELENLSDDFLSYKTASIVFHQAVKTVPQDLPFRVSFLSVYQLFEGSQERQEEVYESIKKDFSSHHLCWDTLSRQQWVGVDTATLTDGQVASLEASSEEQYREGLGRVADPAHLWVAYIQWCRERTEDPHLQDRGRIRAIKRLLTAFREAEGGGYMSETMVEQQVQTLSALGLSEEVHRALVSGTLAHPHSPSLWLLRLKCVGGEEGGEEGRHSPQLSRIRELCTEALDKVPKEHSLGLWQYWLEQCISREAQKEEVEGVFQNAIDSTMAAPRETLSGQYINWAAAMGGVKRARKAYKKLLGKPPVSYPVYCKCIEVEKQAELPSVKRLRDLFEKAVSEFGSYHPDLWLDYIQAEACLQGGDPSRVGHLHWRAMKDLRGELTADFVAKYSLLQLAG